MTHSNRKSLKTIRRRLDALTRATMLTSLACLLAAVVIAGCAKGPEEEEAIDSDQLQPIAATTSAEGRRPTDSGQQALPVPMSPVTRGMVASEIELVGTLVPLRTTTVVAEINGVVNEIPASDRAVQISGPRGEVSIPVTLDVGCRVKQGDVLVRLEDRDQRLALQQAEANRMLTERQLADLLSWRREEEIVRLQATLDEMEAQAVCKRLDVKRLEGLRENNAVSAAEHEQAVAGLARAEADVQKAQADLDMANAGPTEEQIAVAKAQLAVAETLVAVAQADLDKMTIRAPYDGVITKRFIEVGDRLIEMKDSEVVELVDPRVLYAQIAVPERYQASLRVGSKASVVAEGFAQPFEGHIELIGGKIDPRTRTFIARIAIGNSDGVLKPGGFVRVRLPIASSDGVLMAPIEAIGYDEGRPIVFVVENGSVAKREVQLGMAGRDHYEIVSGVDQGEIVATGKTAVLSNGMAVQPMPSNALPADAPSAADAPQREEAVR